MQFKIDSNTSAILASNTEAGEVYKMPGMNRYYLRLITCGSVRDDKTEGYKFATLPDAVIVQLPPDTQLIPCNSELCVD